MNKTVQVAGFALKEADAEWFMEYLRETIEFHENRIKTFTLKVWRQRFIKKPWMQGKG